MEAVKSAIDEGANIHANNDEALVWASYYGHLETVKYLVEHGANVHAYDDLALQWASSNGHLKTVKYLVEQGADIHADDDYALQLASEEGHLEVVKYLKYRILLEDYQKQLHSLSQKEKIAIFTAGLPGAGKSSILAKKIDKDLPIIDPDSFKDLLKEQINFQLQGELHKYSALFACNIRNECINNDFGYILDSSLSEPNNAKIELSKVKAKEYKIIVYALAVSQYEALQGVVCRYAEEKFINAQTASKEKPRYVNSDYIFNRYNQMVKAIEEVIKINPDKICVYNREGKELFNSDINNFQLLPNIFSQANENFTKSILNSSKKFNEFKKNIKTAKEKLIQTSENDENVLNDLKILEDFIENIKNEIQYRKRKKQKLKL